MKIFIENQNNVLMMCLNWLRWTGVLVPDELTGYKKKLYPLCFSCWFIFVVGLFIISQFISLVQWWGDVAEMTGVCFLLFTNLTFVFKVANVMMKRKVVQAIIDEGDYEMRSEVRAEGKQLLERINVEASRRFYLFSVDVAATTLGWAVSSLIGHQLPFLVWYPYDTTKFPAYQLTFAHQVIGVFGIASMNICTDFLVTNLVAVCRCRLQLVNLSLRTLLEGITITDKLISVEEEKLVKSRLQRCVLQHQAALQSAAQIQDNFTSTILAQFSVSVLIICATAFQMAEETVDNIVWLIPMATYFFGMLLEVYIYCEEAHKLTEESAQIADAVYECEWYSCGVSVRRALLVMMVRCRRDTLITAGGFVTLSLTCFVSILRVSYSYFTVLRQMEE